MGWIRRRAGRLTWLAVGIAVTAGVIIAAALWPSGHGQQASRPQARHYLNTTACLLTDQQGITPGAPGAVAWRAMQSASLATHVMVSYLADTGGVGATTMLDTLMQRRCGVIITTGTPAASVITAAKANHHQDFVLVADSSTAGLARTSNTVVVSSADASARIDQAIHTLASRARTSGH